MDIVVMANAVFDFETTFQERLPEGLRDPKKRHSEYPMRTVMDILNQAGFFLEIRRHPGAAKALKTMVELGHNVKICITTQTPLENPTGFLEQFLLIEKHFGTDFFISHAMMAKDRTLVACDILVSDVPQNGVRVPTWKLIILDNWDDWREKLGI